MNHPPQKLRPLPGLVLPAGTVLTRIHRAGYESWRLSSDAYGRFNLEHPAGTCYLAFDPICAFLEVFLRGALLDRERLRKYRLTRIELADDWTLADLTHRGVKGSGINAEIHSTLDYQLTRAWAEAISKAGYEGIRYRPRSDPSSSLESIALFSTMEGKRGKVISTEPLSEDLVDEAMVQFDLQVVPRRLP